METIQRISGREIDLLGGRSILIVVVPFLYSLYEFVHLGWERSHFPYTFIVLAGSLVTILWSLAWGVVVRSRPDQKRPLLSFGYMVFGLTAYLFAMYVIFFLGLYRLYSEIHRFALGSLIVGCFWTVFGYIMLRHVWRLSELGVAEQKGIAPLK